MPATASATTMRVALAQTCPAIADTGSRGKGEWFTTLETNLLDARDWVEKAAKGGADVIVFPEYFLHGLVNDGRQYLTYPTEHIMAYLSQLAVEHNVSIVGTVLFSFFPDHATLPTSNPFSHLSISSSQANGAASASVLEEWEELIRQWPAEAHNPKIENTAVFVEAGTGKVIGRYSKRNLWHPERDYLSAGKEEHPVFETKWGKCGFVICWDASHPSSGQVYSDASAEIVFAPTYWIGYDSAPMIQNHHPDPPAYEYDVLTNLSFARAFETETAWIMVNAGGDAKEGYIGGSGVWMPLKGKLGGVQGAGVGMEIIDVDLNVLKDARETYKIRIDWNQRLKR